MLLYTVRVCNREYPNLDPDHRVTTYSWGYDRSWEVILVWSCSRETFYLVLGSNIGFVCLCWGFIAQSRGVISSVVSLTNHTLNGQASPLVNQYFAVSGERMWTVLTYTLRLLVTFGRFDAISLQGRHFLSFSVCFPAYQAPFWKKELL